MLLCIMTTFFVLRFRYNLCHFRIFVHSISIMTIFSFVIIQHTQAKSTQRLYLPAATHSNISSRNWQCAQVGTAGLPPLQLTTKWLSYGFQSRPWSQSVNLSDVKAKDYASSRWDVLHHENWAFHGWIPFVETTLTPLNVNIMKKF